jgi:hypothetical protein
MKKKYYFVASYYITWLGNKSILPELFENHTDFIKRGTSTRGIKKMIAVSNYTMSSIAKWILGILCKRIFKLAITGLLPF